jgi:CheY-like chemotaxis protein
MATKVLIAEDDDASRELLIEVLDMCGFDVCAVRNGQEALDQFESYLPDLVVLDIQMPVLDGIRALRQLRRLDRGAHLPVIALTAFAMAGERERFLAEGFDGCLAKPFSATSLRQELKKHLRSAAGGI